MLFTNVNGVLKLPNIARPNLTTIFVDERAHGKSSSQTNPVWAMTKIFQNQVHIASSN